MKTQSPILGLLVCLMALSAHSQLRYNVVGLEYPSDPSLLQAFGIDINDHGYAIGSAYATDTGQMVMWQHSADGGFSRIGSYAGYNISPRAVNNQGQVAVIAYAELEKAFRYTPGIGYQDLGTLGGNSRDSEHAASGINSLGQVTGYSERSDGAIHAFRYTDGVGMQDLGTLGGLHSSGYDLNDFGWVTGRSRVADGSDHAFLFRDDKGMVDLGPGGGVSINNQGVVGGMSGGIPVLFKDGQIVSVGTLAGVQTYGVGALNDANVMVGGYLTGDLREFAFIASETGGMVDLNTLIDPNSGWLLTSAAGINNQGQIVGQGIYEGRYTAFRLDAIPEPSTWALLGLGAVGLGWARWRRK